MTPEELIGPAAAKALAEHFDLTPKAKPLPEIVTDMECRHFWDDYEKAAGTSFEAGRTALSAFVLRWLRSRLEALPLAPTAYGDSRRFGPGATEWVSVDILYKRLTGREWTP